MNAPDKIYVEVRHPFGNEFTEMLGFESRGNSDDIEYIRKDAILDWSRKMKRQVNLSSAYNEGFVDAINMLLVSINSI